MKISINVAVDDALIRKPAELAETCLEKRAYNNYHQSNGKAAPRKCGRKFNVDVVVYLAYKVDSPA